MNTANNHRTRRRTRDEQIADKRNAVVALRLLAADPLMPDARAAALMHSAAGLEREIAVLQAAQGEADERALLAAADSLPADLPIPFRAKGIPLPPDLVVPVTREREPEHPAFDGGGDGGGVHIDGGGGEGDGGDEGDDEYPLSCESCGCDLGCAWGIRYCCPECCEQRGRRELAETCLLLLCGAVLGWFLMGFYWGWRP